MIERHSSIDPVHPGEILREDMLPELAMSKTAVAAALGGIAADAVRYSQRAAASDGGDGSTIRQAVRQRRWVLGEPATQL